MKQPAKKVVVRVRNMDAATFTKWLRGEGACAEAMEWRRSLKKRDLLSTLAAAKREERESWVRWLTWHLASESKRALVHCSNSRRPQPCDLCFCEVAQLVITGGTR